MTPQAKETIIPAQRITLPTQLPILLNPRRILPRMQTCVDIFLCFRLYFSFVCLFLLVFYLVFVCLPFLFDILYYPSNW
jgi:hypothetical protein